MGLYLRTECGGIREVGGCCLPGNCNERLPFCFKLNYVLMGLLRLNCEHVRDTRAKRLVFQKWAVGGVSPGTEQFESPPVKFQVLIHLRARTLSIGLNLMKAILRFACMVSPKRISAEPQQIKARYYCSTLFS